MTQEQKDEVRNRISKSVKKRWAEKSPSEMLEFSNKMSNILHERLPEVNNRVSKGLRESWANKSIEEKNNFREMVSLTHKARSQEDKEAISLKISTRIKWLWDNTDTYGDERNRKVGLSIKKAWENLPPEKYAELMENKSVQQREIFWSKTPEERNKWIGHAIEGQKKKPSRPEILLLDYLDNKYPRRWLYNGDGRCHMVIGRKVPDFVRADGIKEVIEVFGAPGFRHYFGEEEIKVEHYKSYGYKCLVIWEWDCGLPIVLDKLFEEFENA